MMSAEYTGPYRTWDASMDIPDVDVTIEIRPKPLSPIPGLMVRIPERRGNE